ncbi:MAG TPA: hypothetical protein VF183_15770 [Acidimicrobiales bacterium]
MSDSAGWRPLQKPQRAASVTLAPTPFTRLARLHGLAAAADGMVTVALAGSIFFSIEPDAARWRVALYLLLTIAPFAVVTPLIGPVIDRTKGGRRGMILATAVARGVVAFLMVSNIESILLFPLAFALLVLQKTYSVAKSAVVPKLVGSEHKLVEANSKLALLSSIAGMGGAAVGAIVSFIGGPSWAAAVAVIVYLAAALAGIHLPRIVVADTPIQEHERAELRGGGIVLAATGMGVLRGIVGFMTFLLAFELRGGKDGVDVKPDAAAVGAATALTRNIDIVGDPGAPAWHFGAVVVAAGFGALVGARVAPYLRERFREEHILLGAFVLTAAVALEAIYFGELIGAMTLSLAVAIAAAAGKLAFDSIVQRDAPDANYGRSFARFEARFQLTWVTGAFVPVVLPLPERVGYLLVLLAAGFATVTYYLGTRAAAAAPTAATAVAPPPPGPDPGAAHTRVLPREPLDPTARFDTPPHTSPSDPTVPGAVPADPVPADPVPADPAPAGAGPSRELEPRVDPATDPATETVESQLPPPPPAPTRWADAPVPPLVSSVDGVEVEDVDTDAPADHGAHQPAPKDRPFP